ncbi:MAG TPA: MarR family winged helix-turn-helix transcriptional regulator [Candidatus Saccharimonadales bacterium]|nr:MarR family winged helix-turn-helix transcriptional regulator [Candidatus Saccharimonadales bacterium]
MKNERQKLLQELIQKLTEVFQATHKDHCFSFDGLALRRQEMMILFFVNEKKGQASVKEIAKFLKVTSGAVTQFVDGLVEKKLVERKTGLVDRRQVNIKLRPNVKSDFGNFKKRYLESISTSFSILSDNELQQLIKLLEKVSNSSK